MLLPLPFGHGKQRSRVGRRAAPTRAIRKQGRLSLEQLEDRTLLAADVGSRFSSLELDPQAYDPYQILVRFREEAAVGQGANILAGAQFGAPIGLVPGLRTVRLPENVGVEAALKAYRASPLVRYAEPDYRVSAANHVAPDDPNFPQLYGLHNTGQTGGAADADIDAPEAWHINTGSPSVIVGVIDTGVDYNHQDLAANVWTNPGEIPGDGLDNDSNGWVDDIHGINAIDNTSDPMDDNGHGTHVSGTIGATAFDEGVVGVNWRVSIIGLKFLDAFGSGYTSDAIKCFDYLNNLKLQGHNVVASNNSWGGGEFSQALADAIAGPQGMADILHVFAAGNYGGNNDLAPFYPASYTLDNMLAVAATDHNDLIADFSSYGATSVDLAAPGVGVLSAFPNNGYGWLDGTSMATPHVTGAAALVASAFPGSSADQIKQRILSGVDPIGAKGNNSQKPTATNGRLNVANALSGATPEFDNTPPAVVNDLAVSGAGLFSVTLTWTAPGDDGATGTASFYDLRYSTSPISSEADWDAATKAIGEPGPQPVGSTETATVAGLDHSSSYYFAMKVRDNLGNPSALSNTAQGGTQTATILYEEDMESGAPGWEASGLWHPAAWRSNSSDFAFYYGDDSSLTYDTYYCDDFWCYSYPNSGVLTSSAIDLTGVSEAILTFYEWRQVEDYAPYDGAYLYVSTDGVSWEYVWDSYSSTNAWVERIVDLTPWVGNNVYLHFYFDTLDEFSNFYEGWYIDDVTVLAPGPPEPGLYINNVSVTEGDSGMAEAEFKVKLIGASGPVTVDWATTDGGATDADNDYQPDTNNTLNFAAGETEKIITVLVNGDHVDEANETFFVNLTNAVGAPIIDGEGRGTIVDDDTAGITVNPSSGLVTTENGGTANFTVALSSQPAANVTVNLESSDASEGMVSPASLTFTPDDWNAPKSVTVTGVNDEADDGDVSYYLTASAASSDPQYNGPAADVSAVNRDNDVVAVFNNNTAQNIPDAKAITSKIVMSGAFTLRDVNVRLNIDHGRDQDLDVYLTHPDGVTRVELFTDVGENGKNFNGTVLDDEAATPIAAGSAPFSGSYRPEGLLSALDDKTASGMWTLTVVDDLKGGKKGKLNSWSITVAYEDPSIGGAGAEAIEGESPETSGGALNTLASNPWHNAVESADVDGDGDVSLRDALFAVQGLRDGLLGALPSDGSPAKHGYLDVDDDGAATVSDLLGVVGEVRAKQLQTAAETAARSIVRDATPRELGEFTPLDLFFDLDEEDS